MAAGPTTLSAARLRLRFVRRGDRYAHEVCWADAGGSERVLLATVEGDDATPWPASPPLQDLHLEQRPVGITVALAVGMAGRSHWSLSAEALPEGELRFDAACRANDSPGPIGSCYRLGEGVTARAAEGAVWLALDGHEVARIAAVEEIAVLRLPATPEIPSPSHDADLAIALAIAPSTVPAAAPFTVRWQYVIQASN